MKVNMTPNPLDVVTIHASQGDTEAREWGFELHNNGEKIDSSSISDQLVFKAYKGGTEEILPTNGSTPTTSPFNGDIKYPQGLLTDQEFLYRESPTEEDGLAKITDIKGNTLVWNQLVPTDWMSTRTFSDGLSVTNNNDGSYTINGTATASRFPTRNTEIYGIQGHKYYIQLLSSQSKAVLTQTQSTVYVSSSAIYTAQNNNTFVLYFNANTYSNEKIIPMVIDLTQMGLDISSPSDFTSLFPLPYYSYNQGTLLSFNGNGIKTVGKNLFHNTTASATNNGITWTVNEDGSVTANGTCTTNVSVFKMYTPLLRKGTYIANGTPSGSAWGGSNPTWRIRLGHQDGSYINDVYAEGRTFTLTQDEILEIQCNIALGKTVSNQQWFPMIRFADVADSTFEPYTSSTLSLPISTYFPTGMKSAGSVYDELLPTKAVTRIGAVDLGSLTWTYRNEVGAGIFSASVTNSVLYKQVYTVGGLCANYTYGNPVAGASQMVNAADKSIRFYLFTPEVTARTIYVKDSSFSDPTAFKTAMSGVYLYYELATPTETSITTASLVTENAEIPLSNEDGVLIGKCTEQLSENPGFIDAKIKLSDADGECYSNKIQLHIERSPQ